MCLLRGYHCVHNFFIGNVLVTFITLNFSLIDICMQSVNIKPYIVALSF